MFRLLIAIVLLWALMTSGVSIVDLGDAALSWVFDRVQVTLR